MKLQRLDKYLTECGLGSRSDVKNLIRKKRISINGITVNDIGSKVSCEDTVCFDGKELLHEEYVYYMLNKPGGVVSATTDNYSDTVICLLKEEKRNDIFPVGRLDKDTVGLLLITNDGKLSHELLAPKKHVDKTYYVITDRQLCDEALQQFAIGVDIGEEEKCKPATITKTRFNEEDCRMYGISQQCRNMYHYEVTITEGRFHQIKRMFESFGSTVVFLKRLTMASLSLDSSLMPGQYRKLTDEEIEQLSKRKVTVQSLTSNVTKMHS